MTATATMDIQAALADLGVCDDTLSADERASLDRDGYLMLRDILYPELTLRMATRVDELAQQEREAGVVDGQKEAGTERVADLLRKDPMFDVCLTHPRLLAAIAHVLRGEFRSFGISARSALPGGGHQDMHQDWKFGATPPGEFYRCNSAWLLDDFTKDNGPTRIVPGSHRTGRVPRDEMTDPSAAHPREVHILAPAGTVIIFNSHMWHGGTTNHTNRPRRVIHSYFRRPHPKEPPDQHDPARAAHFARLSDAARYVFNV